MKKQTLLTAMLIAGATGLVAAAPSANADDVITKVEFTEMAKAKFRAADLDNDGQLTEQERANLNRRKYSKRKAAKRESQRARMLLEFDTNQDGRMSADEEAVYIKSFQDTSSRTLNATEKRKMRQRARLDTNLDGYVSEAEYLKLTDILFAITDKDKDGVIEQNEGNPLGSWLRSG